MNQGRLFKMSLFIQAIIVTCLMLSTEVSGRNSVTWMRLCEHTCQNGGKCVARDKCECRPNFSGQYCDIAKYPYPDIWFPALPMHSRTTCGDNECQVVCMEGYKFSDGASTMKVFKKNDQWLTSGADANRLPECKRS